MRKIVLLLFSLTIFSCLNKLFAGPLKDTTLFIQQVFEFFENDKGNKTREVILRSEQSPQWHEIALQQNFEIFGKARLRLRKANCFKLKELVFGAGKFKDAGLAERWKKKEIFIDITNDLLNLRDRLVDIAVLDSLNFRVDDSYFLTGLGKHYHNMDYAIPLFVLEEGLPMLLEKKQPGRKLLISAMLETRKKDEYELQIVFSEYVDNCMGI